MSSAIYALRADAPGLRGLEVYTAEIDRRVAATPGLTARGTTVGAEDTSTLSKVAAVYTAGIVGEWTQEYVVTRFSSTLPTADAERAVREIQGDVMPTELGYSSLVLERFADEVVAQTAADAAAGAAKAGRWALPVTALVVVGLGLWTLGRLAR